MSCVRLVCRYRSAKGNKMRFCFGAVLVSLALSLSQSAQAGPIVGSEALAGNGTALGGTPTNDVTLATSVSWNSFTDTHHQTGDFTVVPNGTVINGSSTLELHTGTPTTPWTITDSAWGTFTETKISEIDYGTNAVTAYLQGTFTPGTLFDSSITSNTATMIISLNQAGGPGQAVSTGATLTTPAIPIPEPSTVAILLSGIAFVGLPRLLRRK